MKKVQLSALGQGNSRELRNHGCSDRFNGATTAAQHRRCPARKIGEKPFRSCPLKCSFPFHAHFWCRLSLWCGAFHFCPHSTSAHVAAEGLKDEPKTHTRALVFRVLLTKDTFLLLLSLCALDKRPRLLCEGESAVNFYLWCMMSTIQF